ncbi:hypothetical protein KIW84_UN0773 [Lathyrus oleraceus]|nr:hypothetical protein KIW84_UN0773 [Pisum sativum]
MMTSPRAFNNPGLGHHHNPRRSIVSSRLADRHKPLHIRPRHIAGPHRFPPDNFKALFDSLFKVLFIFPLAELSLSVSRQYLALDGIYRPIGAAFPNTPTRRQRLVVRQGRAQRGSSPSPAPPSRGIGPGPPLRTLLQTTIRTPRAIDSHGGLIPVRSPLLREILLILTEFNRATHDWSRGSHNHHYHGTPYKVSISTNHETKESSREANIHPAQYLSKGNGRRLQYVTPGRRALNLMASGATCVQRLDGSRDSAIHTKYRISLRSSSMQEPRYPLPRVFYINVSKHNPHGKPSPVACRCAQSKVKFP